MDRVDHKTRSRIMASVKSKNTAPELVVRKLAHRLGYRFRLHRRDLPGTPDLVFPKYRTVVQVNGCFWHGHRGCRHAVAPKSNAEFWKAKIEGNQARDLRNTEELSKMNWKVLTIWGCEVKNESILTSILNLAMPPTSTIRKKPK